MSVRLTERRRHSRTSAAHRVAVCDRRGKVLLRARTSNISEGGLFCLTEARQALGMRGRLIVEIDLPSCRPGRPAGHSTRTVRYAGRVVRVEEVGQLVGIAIELIEKLS